MSGASTRTNILELLKFSFGRFFRLFACGFCMLGSIIAHADYPLISHKFSAAPLRLEFNGHLYLYCSNGTDNNTNLTPISIACNSGLD